MRPPRCFYGPERRIERINNQDCFYYNTVIVRRKSNKKAINEFIILSSDQLLDVRDRRVYCVLTNRFFEVLAASRPVFRIPILSVNKVRLEPSGESLVLDGRYKDGVMEIGLKSKNKRLVKEFCGQLKSEIAKIEKNLF